MTVLILRLSILLQVIIISVSFIMRGLHVGDTSIMLSAATYAPRVTRADRLKTEKVTQEVQIGLIVPQQPVNRPEEDSEGDISDGKTYPNTTDPLIAKFCYVGQKLQKIKDDWEDEHDEQISHHEWARAANLTVNRLNVYLALARKAKNQLRVSHLSFVKNIARKTLSKSMDSRGAKLETVFHSGLTGLEQALEKYDGRVKFSSYAYPFIQKAIWESLSEKPGVFLPHYIRMNVYQASKVKKRLNQQLNRAATDEEVADELGISVKRLRQDRKLLRTVGKHALSLNEVAGGGRTDSSSQEGGGDTYGELLDAQLHEQELPYDSDTMQWQIRFLSALDMLESSEKRFLALRYGLLDGKLRSVERVAELMCVTRDGAQKALESALEKVRKSPFKDVLDSKHV